MAIKDDVIRVRVSKEQKELFKSIAKRKKVSMSEFIVVATEERALKEQEKLKKLFLSTLWLSILAFISCNLLSKYSTRFSKLSLFLEIKR